MDDQQAILDVILENIRDAVKALKNDTADNKKLRAVIEERKNSWYHA